MGVLRHECAPYVCLPVHQYKRRIAPVPMSKDQV